MNGKLFLKRKREEQQLQNAKRERYEAEQQVHNHHHPHQRPSVINENPATPPPSPPAADINCGQVIVPSTRNRILLEALQKIVELQQELDDFENDLDCGDEYGLPDEEDSDISFYLDEQQQEMERQSQRHEAEALGFAMCARETLLFLQREGIPQDSLVYRTLHEKLVGQVEAGIPI